MTIRAVELAAKHYAAVLEKLSTATANHNEAERVLEHTTETRQDYACEVREALEALEKCREEARKQGDYV